MRAPPRGVTLGILLKKAEGRLNLFELDHNFYPALGHDCTKRFVKNISTENCTEAPENQQNVFPPSVRNLTLGGKSFYASRKPTYYANRQPLCNSHKSHTWWDVSLKNRGRHLGLRERFLRPGIGLGLHLPPRQITSLTKCRLDGNGW